MKQLLIVAATVAEIEPFLKSLHIDTIEQGESKTIEHKLNKITFLITGVGMVNTAFQLGKISSLKFDYAINAGIAGAFNKTLKLGEVVIINEDEFAEMGAEDGDNFISYSELKLGGTSKFTSKNTFNSSAIENLIRVKGITVNKVHGNENSIAETVQHFHPDVESMEGAAFLSCSKLLSNSQLQLRAISNYVEKRDKSKWEIKLAIENLNSRLIQLIDTF